MEELLHTIEFVENIRQHKLIIIAFVLMVFALQPYKVGFESGHHGWVSAHGLALISNATPDNNFLGYTQKTLKEGKEDYLYFDRYPFIFAGGMNLILSTVWDRLDLTIYLARQLMNVIFILSGLLVLRLCRKLFQDPVKAIYVTGFILSSSFLIKYKDMVHFDQPALLGCLLALNGIVDYERERKKKYLIIGALLGSLLGRGYAVVFFLAGWILISLVREWKLKKKVIPAIKALPLIYLFISIPLPALFLGSNIYSEAKIRNIHWEETSIVKSAKHRFGILNYKTKDAVEKKFSWGSYISNQIQRTLDYLTPYSLYGLHVKNFKEKLLHYSSLLPKAIYQILLLFIFFKYFRGWWRQQNLETKWLYCSLSSGGFLWLIVMRNLANYHDYVTLYLIGLVILIWSFLFDQIQRMKWNLNPVVLTVVLSSICLHSVMGWREAGKVNWQSSEFQRIRNELKASDTKRVYLTPSTEEFFLDGVKWGDSFLLSGFTIVHDQNQAQKQISKSYSSEGVRLDLE